VAVLAGFRPSRVKFPALQPVAPCTLAEDDDRYRPEPQSQTPRSMTILSGNVLATSDGSSPSVAVMTKQTKQARAMSTRAQATGASSTGASSVAFAAVIAAAAGAVAMGAVAIGALAIGRLRIGDAAVRRLSIEELEVDQLRVRRLQVLEQGDVGLSGV
jgi:hypothetical protein